MQTFGDRLKQLLESKSISPYSVAKGSKIHQSTIGRIIENSTKPNDSTIDAVCNYLSTGIDSISEEDIKWLRFGKSEISESNEKPIEPDNDTQFESSIDTQRVISYRLREILAEKGVTDKEIAEKMYVSPQNFSNYLTGKRNITDKFLVKASQALEVPFDLLRFGKESPKFNEAAPLAFVDETDVATSKSGMEFRDLDNGMVLMTMTLVPEFAYASYPHGWRDPEYLVELPKYSIVLPKREQGLFRAFEVRGDSMDDGTKYSISHGDVAVGRLVDLDLWDQRLHSSGGTDYIIVTHDGVILKRIVGHDIKESTITCASRNPNKTEFPDFTLRLTEVFELYKIRKIDRDWNRN